MRLASIFDLGAVFGASLGARSSQDAHDPNASKLDRLGFLPLSAAVQMDRRGFLYAPLKQDPASNSPAAK